MKKLFFASLLTGALALIAWKIRKSGPNPSDLPHARSISWPNQDLAIIDQDKENKSSVIVQSSARREVQTVTKPLVTSDAEMLSENNTEKEMAQKNMALIQQVSMAVAELPAVRAGLDRVKALHAELAHASAERQAAIDVELKAIEARHTEFYREAFRNLGMPESQVRGIQITLPKPTKPEASTPPTAGQPAQPTFQ